MHHFLQGSKSTQHWAGERPGKSRGIQGPAVSSSARHLGLCGWVVAESCHKADNSSNNCHALVCRTCSMDQTNSLKGTSNERAGDHAGCLQRTHPGADQSWSSLRRRVIPHPLLQVQFRNRSMRSSIEGLTSWHNDWVKVTSTTIRERRDVVPYLKS